MLERTRQAPPGTMAGPWLPEIDEAVERFWSHHRRHRAPPRDCIARITELALSDERDVAAQGTRALFGRIVEPLCDGFLVKGVETYRRTFAQVIAVARRQPCCASLDRALNESGIRNERQLKPAPPPPGPTDAERERVRLVVVMSRMTLGADVAIVGPILEHMAGLFPAARIALVGGDGAGPLARSVPRGALHRVPYEREDGLAGRLNAWPALREAVHALCADLAPEEYLLVDPDSRLTQLGLLRPEPAGRCFHFPSRSYGGEGRDALAVLVRRWLDGTFGPVPSTDGGLRVAEIEAGWAAGLRGRWEHGGPLVSVSFGVGANPLKRAGAGFEADLIEWLVGRGCRVLLARGAGTVEVTETYRLCRDLVGRGVVFRHLPPGTSLDGRTDPAVQVVTWEAGVEAFIAAIGCADAYVGYDSAGQHVAASLGVPTLSVFVESAGARHAWRWAPRGPGPVRVVRLPPAPERAVLMERVTAEFAALMREANRAGPAR